MTQKTDLWFDLMDISFDLMTIQLEGLKGADKHKLLELTCDAHDKLLKIISKINKSNVDTQQNM